MPNSTPSHAARIPDAIQLTLFADNAGRDPEPEGVSPDMARAAVSAGWWQYVDALYSGYSAPDLVVHECREIDGELVIRATSRTDDTESADFLIERLREAASRTCGCCGHGRARPYRPRVDRETRIVCDECRARLVAGESYLAVADSHWRLDGSRRIPPLVPAATVQSPDASAATLAKRVCEPLPPEQLRQVITNIRAAMRQEIVGHDDAVAQLALIGGLHVAGGISRGTRVLLLGPSGCGKTSLIDALQRALAEWDLAWVRVDCIDLSSAGWAGPSVGDLLASALAGAPPDSPRARHAVVVLDELHHVGVIPDTTGNSAAKRAEVLASLLGLAGHGTLRLGDTTTEWSSRNALIIALGAFSGLLDLNRPITIRHLVTAGIPIELATRLADETIVLHRLGEVELVRLLRQWPALASLTEVCTRLGFTVRVTDEAYARAARVVMLGHDESTARTAGSWLTSALRSALNTALDRGDTQELIITPDSLPIPSTATRRPPPDDPPAGAGGWDATLILTPH